MMDVGAGTIVKGDLWAGAGVGISITIVDDLPRNISGMGVGVGRDEVLPDGTLLIKAIFFGAWVG